ncbi:E3 ubiquitin-protein ligase Topors-like [Grus japonensis]|uniref:RING-type E3 ubiquitin transferase n=1 Tax=Grus japonensis TaxID=30415 RepID=A0ABC9XYH2_GRUJA
MLKLLLTLLSSPPGGLLGGPYPPLPPLSPACFALVFLVPLKLRHVACLSWQDMASGAKEAPEQSGSAVLATPSWPQQAGQLEAEADALCPIGLGTMCNAACVPVCFHRFCFGCVRRWASGRAMCPLCRQPFDCVLHTVRVDNDYRQYAVGSSDRRQRNAARNRVRSRNPQRRY